MLVPAGQPALDGEDGVARARADPHAHAFDVGGAVEGVPDVGDQASAFQRADADVAVAKRFQHAGFAQVELAVGAICQKVLLLENIHPAATEVFQRNGFQVQTRSRSLPEDELIEAVQGVSLLGVRSNTNVTA